VEIASLTAAIASRAENVQRNAQDDKRIAAQTATEVRTNELIRRKQTDEAQARRKQSDILRSRDDIEADVDRARLLRGQRDVNDQIGADNRFSILRDKLTDELNSARADRAAAEFLIESEFFEAGALDSIDPAAAPDAPAGPQFSDLLQERDVRLSERESQVRDDSIQQRIDLQLADDRIRELDNSPSGASTERGSIVDVFG